MNNNAARNARIIEMRQAKVGPREIARRLMVTPQVVAGVLHRAGMTDPNSPHNSRPRIDPAFKNAVMNSDYSSDAARAAAWGVSPSALCIWRKEARADPAYREKMSARPKTKRGPLSDEAKQKISEAAKARHARWRAEKDAHRALVEAQAARLRIEIGHRPGRMAGAR